MFDNGAKEYFTKYGGGVDHLAMIGECDSYSYLVDMNISWSKLQRIISTP